MTDPGRGYQRLFAELKRRKVFRVMAVYGATAFVVLQVADLLAEGMGLSDQVLRVTTFLVLVGFPIAVVLAWAFESTPEGVKLTKEATPEEISEILAQPATRRWPAGLLALAGVVLLFVGGWWMGRRAAPPDGRAGTAVASIAVLPLENMSDDPSNAYFADGISEELLNLLARIPELHVAARTSSFAFKGQNLGIPAIADSLNVAHVLEGSVRKSGNDVRITVQLIRADDGFHLWSETWDRTLDDIFVIQDEIAAVVVEKLKVSLLGAAPTVKETDPEAYALYLQAQQVGRQFTPESLERSNALYQLALEIDPDYAPAWSSLAANYGVQSAFLFRSVDEGFRLAREAAERALAIDAGNAAAYASLSTIARVHDNDLAAAARHMERALALAPTDLDVMRDAAAVLTDLGRLDESISPLEYVAARDPVNPVALMGLGGAYMWAGRPNEALPLLRGADSLVPGRTASRYAIGSALLDMGQPEAALAEIRQEPHEQYRLLGLARAYHALGQSAASDSALAVLIERHAQDWAYNIAYVFAFRGEADRAFEWLDKAVEYNDTGLSQLPIENLFANIHDDPRWIPFLESIGKSPEQLAAIEFDVPIPGSAP